MFFWNSLAFSMIQQMLAIWSLVPLPFLNPARTFGSSQFTYCWSLTWATLLACGIAIMCSLNRNQRSNCQHQLDHRKSKRIPEKYLLLLHWLCWSLWLCGSQQTMENSKEMGIPDHFTWLLRNPYAGQEATIRTKHGTKDWFKIGKEVCQSCILSSLFSL